MESFVATINARQMVFQRVYLQGKANKCWLRSTLTAPIPLIWCRPSCAPSNPVAGTQQSSISQRDTDRTSTGRFHHHHHPCHKLCTPSRDEEPPQLVCSFPRSSAPRTGPRTMAISRPAPRIWRQDSIEEDPGRNWAEAFPPRTNRWDSCRARRTRGSGVCSDMRRRGGAPIVCIFRPTRGSSLARALAHRCLP